MEIDETNLADIEQEAPAIEPDETDDEPVNIDDEPEDDTEADDGQDGEGDEEPEEIEYAEVELNGKKYQIPAELKDGYLMQSDYTRKTQEVAEQRKQIEARQAEIEALQQTSQEELNVRAELIGINQRLDEYQKVDWNAWQDEDPMAAQRGWMEYQQLEKKAGQAGQYLNQVQGQRTEKTKQETASRLQETRRFAEAKIKGWTPEVDAKVTKFATETLGFPVDTLINAYSPPVYQALYLAWVGQQSLDRQSAAKPNANVQQLRPTAKVSAKGGAPATKSLADMSVDEYAAYRNKQEAKKRSR